jgi:hypothetical protein
MADTNVTKELLNEYFEYSNGKLFWKKMLPKSDNLIGKEAGRIAKDGYRILWFMGKNRLTHRMIYLMHNGVLPKFLDHINRDRLDNRIENLREATSRQNAFNRTKPQTNTSGHKNITWNKANKKWQVHLMIERKTKYFGTYFDINVAKFVAETMRYKYFGKFGTK